MTWTRQRMTTALLASVLAAAGVVGSAAGPADPADPGDPGERLQAGQPAPPAVRPAQRRGAPQVMTLRSTAWPDGAAVPARHTQAGEELSPPLAWDNVPEGTVSFVLMVHDLDAATGAGTDDVLHWMLWNIPGAVRELPEGVAAGDALPDGTRQISVSGPYYRGPGAPAGGPAHHYVFELFALDTTVDVPAVGASPAQTRAAVAAAMAGHVRGKGVYVGLYRR